MMRAGPARVCLICWAALLMSVLPSGVASAADLGGDCCADLEQRVAELEATTVRKSGPVSVTISGYTAKQVFSWDDGVESNTYISDIGPTQATHFKIGGQAKIVPGWTAGFLFRIQELRDSTMGLSQNDDNDDLGVNTQMSYWFLASEDYGKVAIGKQALASKRQCHGNLDSSAVGRRLASSDETDVV